MCAGAVGYFYEEIRDMRMIAVSVFDVKAGIYTQPTFVVGVGAAIRSFTDAVNEQGHPFAKHAADYTLFRVGEWDDEQGVFHAEVPQSLGNALEFVEVKGPFTMTADDRVAVES